ncbi:MAG: hypothetical protein ACUVX8_07070 [Candidatus Zipacnadales bacterium]
MRQISYWLAVTWGASLGTVWSQPQIGYVYPAGGQRGTTLHVVVGGQRLGGAYDVRISGEGVQASVVEYVRPLNHEELGDVARFLPQLVRRHWSARVMEAFAQQAGERRPVPNHPWLRDLDEKTPQEISRLWRRLFDPKKQPNAQIAEQVEIEVSIDADATPGDRALRVMTPAGLTNPICFQVGVLPEISEENLLAASGPMAVTVELPIVLNGQIMPGEVDRFRLLGRKEQQLVIRMQARRLVPYLADAVPGWFQGTMALYDAQGNEVAYSDDYRFEPDPVIFYQVPEDGVYELEVRDAIYRGRDDFVYRIVAGELPFATEVFPLGGREGVPTTATIVGWNLANDTLPLDTTPGGNHVRRAQIGEEGLSNELPYIVDTLPECLEVEPNDTVQQAQEVILPLIINGRIEQARDTDSFRFRGRANEEVVAEVYARRLNSPLDSALRLIDSTGAIVASSDDHDDPEMGLLTHQADSYINVRLPHDGDYWVCLGDAQQQGGKAYAYRLRLGPPQPDFAVRVAPSTVNLPPGGAATVTAHAVRKDGFAGDIQVVLKDAPAGFMLNEGRISSDQESVEMRLVGPRHMVGQTFAIQMEARAQIGGVTVTRSVVPAEDMMQAFAYRHLVPQQELLVTITGGGREIPAVWRPLVPGIQAAPETPVLIPLGGTVQVQLSVPQTLPDRWRSPLETLTFKLIASPPGLTLRSVQVVPTGLALTLKADPNIAQVGDAGHVIVEAYVEPENPKRGRRTSLGVLPAIPVEVVKG